MQHNLNMPSFLIHFIIHSIKTIGHKMAYLVCFGMCKKHFVIIFLSGQPFAITRQNMVQPGKSIIANIKLSTYKTYYFFLEGVGWG